MMADNKKRIAETHAKLTALVTRYQKHLFDRVQRQYEAETSDTVTFGSKNIVIGERNNPPDSLQWGTWYYDDVERRQITSGKLLSGGKIQIPGLFTFYSTTKHASSKLNNLIAKYEELVSLKNILTRGSNQQSLIEFHHALNSESTKSVLETHRGWGNGFWRKARWLLAPIMTLVSRAKRNSWAFWRSHGAQLRGAVNNACDGIELNSASPTD